MSDDGKQTMSLEAMVKHTEELIKHMHDATIRNHKRFDLQWTVREYNYNTREAGRILFAGDEEECNDWFEHHSG